MNLLEVGLDEQSQILCIDGLDVVLVHSDQITVLPAGFLNKANWQLMLHERFYIGMEINVT